MNNKNKFRNKLHPRGFSLLELLLAMTLGLFLAAGVGTVYVSSKQTYAANSQMAELDENARVAIRALKEHIEHAGYTSMGVPVNNYILPAGTTVTAATCADGDPNIVNPPRISSSTNGPTVFGTASSADTVGGDTIGVIYSADAKLNVDCLNTALRNACLPDQAADPQASLVYNSFRVYTRSNRNSINEEIPALGCGGSTNYVTQPWAQGVENMQIRYGVDVVPAVIPAGQKKTWEVDNYWSAAEVTTNNAWDKIALVQLALLVRSVDPVFPDAQAMSYTLFDTTVNTDDRYKRSVYTTTVHLRNIAR